MSEHFINGFWWALGASGAVTLLGIGFVVLFSMLAAVLIRRGRR